MKIVEQIRGAKNRHPLTKFVCDCGRERIARSTRVRLGSITTCARCAKADAARRGGNTRRRSNSERIQRERYSTYKNNASRKGTAFEITFEQFAAFLDAPCDYCGDTESAGVDRIDCSIGYVVSNCCPCCSTCNYAKRTMTRDAFLAWIERVYEHQSSIQRD